MMAEVLRVLLVDDHVMFRDGVRGRLEREAGFVVVGEAATAADAEAFLERSPPDIMILDIRLPDRSGIALARKCRKAWPALKILVVSGYDFDQYVAALARIGIEGYLTKDTPLDDLVRALHEIGRGGTVLPPTIASKVMRSYRKSARGATDLTLRELDVLELLAAGLTNPTIAERLGLSARTVESHVATIMAKLGAKSRTDAVRLAMEEGLLR
jgi:DNA-binding NarL/FixJ family response regulator